MREARIAAGISQSRLAAEIGCKQNAISMVEQGDGTKLNEEAIRRICEKFQIDLTPPKDEFTKPSIHFPVVREIKPHTAYCPNAFCPSHAAYCVDGRRLLRPDRGQQDPVGGKYCAICGEILERCCPNCGAPIHEGAICSFCGTPYVTVI
ncbi:MAG: helix-turn-helix domain-containing protein [Kiritimatiellia bacterium]